MSQSITDNGLVLSVVVLPCEGSHYRAEVDTRKKVFADEVEKVKEEEDVGKIEEVCRKWERV